jgi:hypothetical protein
MKNSKLLNVAIVVGAAWVLSTTQISAATENEPQRNNTAEIRACVDRALPELSMRQSLAVFVTGSSGKSQETARSLHWKRIDEGFSRALIRITSPARDAGLAVLLLERDGIDPGIYMYSPQLKRSRRITGGALSASIMGTDLSYEDFTHRMKIIKSHRYDYVEDQMLAGHAVYVLETEPNDGRSAYSRIRTYMDKTICVPVRTEFFGLNGSLDKEITVQREKIELIGDRHIPFYTLVLNHKKNTRSEFVVIEAEVDPELRNSLFNPSELERGFRGG